MRTLKTESGAVYEYALRESQVQYEGGEWSRETEAVPMIRRVNPEAEKRGDGEWQELLTPLSTGSLEGYRMVLVMKSLARYGQDDHGTSPEDAEASGVTTRVTTRVVEDSL